MANTMLYEKGQKLGPYELLAPLKQTRFGQTYQARNTREDVPVIVEVFQPPLFSQDLEQKFLAQAQTLIKLEHPHILPVRDSGVRDYEAFLVTDEGPYWTLREVFPRGSRQPLVMLLPILKQLASALHYAHAHGVIHGDLRPENVLFDRQNTLKLSGFLLDAIAHSRELQGHQHAGAPQSNASDERPQPEASPAGDQYWLAVLIYELLCGTLPFTEATDQDADAPRLLLRQRSPGLSPGAESALIHALEKRPDPGFVNVEAFINELEKQQEPRDRKAPTMASPRSSPDDETTLPRIEQAAASLPSMDEETAQQPAYAPGAQAVIENEHARQAADGLVDEETRPLESSPDVQDEMWTPRRPHEASITRRSFAAGVVGLAALAGAGGWYLVRQRLSGSAQTLGGLSDAQTVTHATIENRSVLIFTGHLASVNGVAWSPDGRLIASASDDNSVQIFKASSGQRTFVYTGHSEEVATVGWSPNGQLIASGGQDGTVQVWHAANGSRALIYSGHAGRVNGVCWSSDSQFVASGSDDKSVQVWSASTGDLNFNLLGHTAGVLCVGWQPDNTSVASGSWDGTLRDWATARHSSHFAAGEQIFVYNGHGKSEVHALAWSPDSSLIASAGADQTVQISNGYDGVSMPPAFTGHKSSVNPILSVAWSPDGKSIASGDAGGNVSVWRASDRKILFTYSGHREAVNALAWSPDGTSIASAGADNTVQVWRPA